MVFVFGGKIMYMVVLMKNIGVIFVNDFSKVCVKGLIGNIYCFGVRNIIVCNYDVCEFFCVMGGFDRVLLDVLCLGIGVIVKDLLVKINRDEKDF